MTTREFFLKHSFSSDVDYDTLLKEFDRQMDAGLAAKESSLAMLPAFIDSSKKVPAETPVIVLDAGGTNLRVAVVWFDKNGKARIEDFQKYSMPGTDGKELSAKEFFSVFAKFLEPVCQRSGTVGFCFSYPTEIYPDLDGRLIRWTKQVNAPEVVNMNVGSAISEAVKELTGSNLSVRILNDTTATLLAGMSAGMSRRYSSYVGFILGTGTNIAYIEKNSRIGKLINADKDGSMIINVESGGFNGYQRSDFDLRASEGLADKDQGIFEKMISGAYIGSCGLAMLKTAAEDGLFCGDAANAILALPSLSTIDFDNFTANPYLAKNPLAEIPFTEDERRLAMQLGEQLFIRAAKLTSANIAQAILRCGEGKDPLHPVCVTIDGSTYYKTRSVFFKSRVEEGLRDILEPRGIHFELISVEDAPMIGSAIAGLIA